MNVDDLMMFLKLYKDAYPAWEIFRHHRTYLDTCATFTVWIYHYVNYNKIEYWLKYLDNAMDILNEAGFG